MNTYIKAIFLMLLSNNLAFSNPAILIDTINVNKEKNKNQFTKYPQFPGGLDGLTKFITDSLRYPVEFLKDSIQGKVYLSFQVSKQGIVNHDSIFIINSPHNALSLEAVKLIKLMPNWAPGIIYDTIAIPVEITLPIPFIYNTNTYQEINDSSFYFTKYNNDSNSFIEFENYSLGRIKYEFQEIYYVVETMPEFPGGINELMKYLRNNTLYPPIARQKDIQGKVYVKFVITQNGDVEKAYVIKGVHPSLDQSALDVINNMPRWQPGKQKGKPVDCWFTLPINYALGQSVNFGHSVDVDKYFQFFQLGIEALLDEKWLIAKQYFTKYLGYRPENPDAYNNRAIAYKKLGNMKKACKDWEKALKFNHPEAQKLLDEYCQEYMK